VVRVATTTLRAGPSPAADAILDLPAEAVVTLLGQASGAWVRVQPADSVVPGWLRGADLARLPDGSATATVSPVGNQPSPAPATTTTVRPEAAPLVVTLLDPLPPPAAPPPAQRVAIAVTVRVGTTAATARPASGQPIPTPRPAEFSPLESLRVQLVTAFGDVLAEGRTDAVGQVALSAAADPGAVLFVQLPVIGLRLPVDPAQAMLTIALPEEAPR
jgi:hypothetical protein